MRYHLRTLMILLAIGPPMLAGSWFGYREYQRRLDLSVFRSITTPLIIGDEEELLLGVELGEP